MESATPTALADDIVIGAADIAVLVYGDARFRRRAYNLLQKSRFPAFKLSGCWAVRRSAVREWIAEQEKRRS